MKTIVSDKSIICRNVVKYIEELLKKVPNANIAFSAADLDDEFFCMLVDSCRAGKIDFSNVKIFSVGEFASGNVLGADFKTRFLDKVNVREENCFLLNSSNYETYDDLIASAGGLDLALLGLGSNCRIGFNEPGTPFSSLTHIQDLTEASKKQLQRFFPAGTEIPEKAVTLGISSIVAAERIVVMAFGNEVSAALFRTMYSRTDVSTPSAFLQIPYEVTVFADRDAAGNL